MLVIVPMAVAGYLLVCVLTLVGSEAHSRAGLRALDHFINASLFNGIAWESTCSHAWRKRDKKWAQAVIWVTDQFQPGYAQKANALEQPVFDLVMRKDLHGQTIF